MTYSMMSPGCRLGPGEPPTLTAVLSSVGMTSGRNSSAMKVSACGKNASWVVENTRSASTPGLGAPGFGVLASCGPLLLALLDTSTILRSEEHTSELQSRGHTVC